jgi:hypothetical protein
MVNLLIMLRYLQLLLVDLWNKKWLHPCIRMVSDRFATEETPRESLVGPSCGHCCKIEFHYGIIIRKYRRRWQMVLIHSGTLFQISIVKRTLFHEKCWHFIAIRQKILIDSISGEDYKICSSHNIFNWCIQWLSHIPSLLQYSISSLDARFVWKVELKQL